MSLFVCHQRYRNEGEQRVMQFFGIADIRPSRILNLSYRGGIKAADFSKSRFGQHAAHFDGSGTPLFKRGVIEKGIGVRIQYLV